MIQPRISSRIFFAFFVFTLAAASPAAPASRPSIAAPAPDAAAVIQAAQRQFNSGNYSNAISTLQSAIAQSPSNAEVYYWLGRSYYELRDYDNAVTAGERSISLDPKNSLYHQWLGRIYGGKADREHSFFFAKKVKEQFSEAVRLNPSNIAARRDLQEYDLDAPWIVGGNKDEARAQVDAIAALDPVQGHLARAVLLMSEGKKVDQAEAEYKQVLAAKPRDLDPYFEVADFYERQNKPEGMDEAIDAAASVDGSDARLSFYRGVSLVLKNTSNTQAEEYLKSYIASTPERSDWPSHAAARDWLGRLYMAEGKQPEAAEQFRAALQLDPGLKDARTRLQQLEKSTH